MRAKKHPLLRKLAEKKRAGKNAERGTGPESAKFQNRTGAERNKVEIKRFTVTVTKLPNEAKCERGEGGERGGEREREIFERAKRQLLSFCSLE